MKSSPNISGAPLDDEELAAWQGMLAIQSRVLRELDRRMSRAHRLSVREFDVLITLFNAPEWRLRMSGLAENVMLSASGLTRLVERLERADLVERRPDPADARSYHAVLTERGNTRLEEARITHNAVIREIFTDRLTPDERRYVGTLWTRLLSG